MTILLVYIVPNAEKRYLFQRSIFDKTLFLFVLCAMREFVLTVLKHKDKSLFYSLTIKINRPAARQVG